MKTKLIICAFLLISCIASARENEGSKYKSYIKTVDTADIAVFYTYYHKRDSTHTGYYSEPFSTAQKRKETDLEAILKLESLYYSNTQEYLKIVADDNGWGSYPAPSPYIPLIKTTTGN
ncbi:MAG: hypothetical protein LKK19_05335 [Bacteroidales bacterium]|jgi:hypothetical protein|nr:hypothetical protein [Bacteroidales bacterium]MCI2122107.1 hypothetical protein [Bacteroidales bacterium]MCI2146338.1 hypothetical protein [Bacteroidales bacterium]